VQKEWYDNFWRNKETPEFMKWWISYYGNAEEYSMPSEEQGKANRALAQEEQDTYWERRGFALIGWRAREGLSLEPEIIEERKEKTGGLRGLKGES